MPSSSSMESVL
uniref:Uncharacterized protein n=1 Tax=Anguilla anguilla TaxID=7936 RepID=A0A0E9TQV9_ANGAN